ncbi:MAG TPA: uroporphyrinogen decarboxylase family protein [Armatimonadota bacterium]|nr:uroporphyrinogen decarboxylase family protein [Armatimonadota bacterium]
MSYQDGWAALNLDMPARVPRTEYSAEGHWDLIRAVTGIDVHVESTEDLKRRAAQAFMAAWNYDFFWSVLISSGEFGQLHTDMGHAVYAAGGIDRREAGTCPFAEPEDALAFDPWEAYGTRDIAEITGRFNAHYRANCQSNPDGVNMTGIYVTCISGLIEIFGWDMLLMAAGMDPDGFGEVANRYAAWMQQYFDALAASDAPVVMVHDDIVWSAGAFIHPDWYRRYVFPNYTTYFAPLLDAGKKIIYTSDANYTEFIDDIAATGVHGFVMEPMTDMAYVAERYGKTHVFIGNVDTRILLSGRKADIRAEVERCMNIGKNCPGFFMAVGNHIPPNTPVENALYYNEVYEELCRR